jgi:hypothetical protein
VSLSAEHQEFYDAMNFDPAPEDSQEREMWLESVKAAFTFDGYDEPGEADLLEAGGAE